MSAHVVSALLMRATRAHMRTQTEGHDPVYWTGARNGLLDAAGAITGYPRAELLAHVVALADPFMGQSLAVAYDQLRAAEHHALEAAGLVP